MISFQLFPNPINCLNLVFPSRQLSTLPATLQTITKLSIWAQRLKLNFLFLTHASPPQSTALLTCKSEEGRGCNLLLITVYYKMLLLLWHCICMTLLSPAQQSEDAAVYWINQIKLLYFDFFSGTEPNIQGRMRPVCDVYWDHSGYLDMDLSLANQEG